ncbi:MAG: hypothetical protein LUD46_22445 [Parabacteroides sp.]|nr:hypothetical protein [Parabacteroides sp.]
MENLFNQIECKEAKAGEVIYDTEQFGNTLFFVLSGEVLICSESFTPPLEIDGGHFILLAAEQRYIMTAITDVQTILMHAGELYASITEDPEWDPDRLVILPILPALDDTLQRLKTLNQK